MDKRIQLAQTQLITSGTDVPGKIFNIDDLTENPTRVKVEHIVVLNSTTTDLYFRLFHDKDGETYDATTMIWASTVCSYQVEQIDINLGVDSVGENLAAQTELALGVTYSVYGVLEGV